MSGAVPGFRRGVVVLAFAEALSAPEVAFSLLGAGFGVIAVTRRGRRPPLRLCRDVRIVEITPPEESVSAARRDLERVAADGGTQGILPLDDAALLLCEDLAANGRIRVIGASAALARFALDKRLQIAAAARAGLRVPETVVVAPGQAVPSAIRLPVILKPALAGRVSADRLVRGSGTICMTDRDLGRAIEHRDESEPLLIQPWIRGVGEGVFGLATDDGVVAWSGHRRVRMMNPAGSGSSACVALAPTDPMRAACERFVRDAGWRGIFMIEMLCDASGERWFMELNGRSWGSMALARRMGFEYPAWAVELALDPAFRPKEPPQRAPVTCRHLGRELVHLLFVMRGPRGARPDGWPSRLGTVWRLLRGEPRQSLYNYRKGEFGLLLDDTMQTLRDQTLRPRRTR